MERTDLTCPLCESRITRSQINTDEYFDMCENEECVYPFDQPDIEGFIYDSPYNETRYSNNNLKHSSPSVANIEPLKASDVDTHNSKSVKESSLENNFNTSSLNTNTNNTSSTPLIESNQVNSMDITQAPPPPIGSQVVLPAGIAFPPEAAAKSSSISSNNKYTLDDINFLLLNDKSTTDIIADCQTPSSPNVTTPEDSNNISWMENMDVLFGQDLTQNKVDPFSGDSEFDSLLGL